MENPSQSYEKASAVYGITLQSAIRHG